MFVYKKSSYFESNSCFFVLLNYLQKLYLLLT